MKKLISVQWSHNGGGYKSVFYLFPPDGINVDSAISAIKQMIHQDQGFLNSKTLAERLALEGYIIFSPREYDLIRIATEEPKFGFSETFLN